VTSKTNRVDYYHPMWALPNLIDIAFEQNPTRVRKTWESP